MAIDHGYTDTLGYYHWAIIYGSDSIAGRRDYYLKTIDLDKGHFQTDEKNSILIDCYLTENSLSSFFEVGNTSIQSTYTLLGNQMKFEILAIGTEPISVTGNQLYQSDTIPEVKALPLILYKEPCFPK